MVIIVYVLTTMDMNDVKKEMNNIGLPGRRTERKPDPKVKRAFLKVIIIRALALLLLLVVFGFGILVVSHYKAPLMTLIVIIYLAIGTYLAYKLWSLTYTGWLYTLFLSVAGILLPALALTTRGFSSPALTIGALSVIAISLASTALLWWVKDLLGIKNYREIFIPYK